VTGRSRQRAQRATQIIGTTPGYQLIDRSVSFLPQWEGPGEECATGSCDCQATAPLIFFVDRNLHQAPAFKGFECRGERGAVHGKQLRDGANGRWFRPVQRHQKRKLPMREIERTEHVVETSRQPARRPLHMQTQAIVTHEMGGGKR